MSSSKPLLIGLGPGPGLVDHGIANTIPFNTSGSIDSEVVGILFDSVTTQGDWWRMECTKLLARGGRIVLLCGRDPGRGIQTEFGRWVTSLARMPILQAGGPLTIHCLAPELARLIEHDLSYSFLGGTEGASLAVAGEANGMVLAAINGVDTGQVAVLPVGIRHNSIEHYVALLNAIPPAEEYPTYLDELNMSNEDQKRNELAEIRNRASVLEAELAAIRQLKRILYVGKLDLELAVVDFLSGELQIPARHVPGVTEDFWLTDGEIDWAIGEVKSYQSGNVDKGAVSQIWTHRREAGRSDDFPALLVANTQYKRPTLAERDEPVHPEVARRGKEDNVLIARTIDLFRMRHQPEILDAFLSTLRKRGGWFRVKRDLTWTIIPPGDLR